MALLAHCLARRIVSYLLLRLLLNITVFQPSTTLNVKSSRLHPDRLQEAEGRDANHAMRREAAGTCGTWAEAPSCLGSLFSPIQEGSNADIILFVTARNSSN